MAAPNALPLDSAPISDPTTRLDIDTPLAPSVMTDDAASEQPHTAQAPVQTTPTPTPTTKRPRDASHLHSYPRGGGGGGASKRGRGGRGGGGGGGRARSASFDDETGAAAPSSSNLAGVVAVPATPIQQQFHLFAQYLDRRNDRREAIYQTGRDLTRQSKKLISQLQRCTTAPPNSDARVAALAEGRAALADLHHMLDATVDGLTPEEYCRFANAYSPGVQEYLEAHSFLHFLETGELVTQQRVEDDIEATLGKKIHISLSDYIVGILDLGGELMRFATNSLASGDRAIVSTIGDFLRRVHAQYQLLFASLMRNQAAGAYKDLPKKMEVWLQSLMKLEALSYKLHIRGAELPDARMLAHALLTSGGNTGEPTGERDAPGGDEDE